MTRKMEDLSGKRFGYLTVVERSGSRNGHAAWLCQCDCGNTKIADGWQLKKGSVKSCGCRQFDRSNRMIDLTGKRFGHLTVIGPTGKKNNSGVPYWKCICDCGNETEVNRQMLVRGRTTMCRECLTKQNSRNGSIPEDLRGRRFGRLTVLHQTENEGNQTAWLCQCDCGNTVVVKSANLKRGKTESCGCLKSEHLGKVQDRLTMIDGTCVEYLEKRKGRSDNTSGYTGVRNLKNGKYSAWIGFKRKRYYLGTYPTFEEAAGQRLYAETLIHKGFVKARKQWTEKDGPFYFNILQHDSFLEISSSDDYSNGAVIRIGGRTEKQRKQVLPEDVRKPKTPDRKKSPSAVYYPAKAAGIK